MADATTSPSFIRYPRLVAAQRMMGDLFTTVRTKLWDNFVELGMAPDRRSFDVCYFPLVHKDEHGKLAYFGTFVPDLYELARANGKQNPFQDAILLPKRKYTVDHEGKLSDEDLRSVASQVSKTLFGIANYSRQIKENLNIYHVDRIPAQGLYFNAKSGIAQSLKDAKPGELINVYGGAKGTSFQLGHIEPTNREKLIHAGLNWLSRGVALMSGIGAALVFAPAAPYAALIAGLTTYYVVTSAEQFTFWDKAEDLIKNNWLTSAKHRKPKQVDFVKLAKTLVIAGMVGYLALEGGMGAYSAAIHQLTSLHALSGVMSSLTPNALMLVKGIASVLSATAGLGAFRGLMWIMHNWLGLGYAKTVITPEETKALPIDDMLTHNQKAKENYENKKGAELNAKLEDSNKEIANLKMQLTQAQNPCVSKVVALAVVFNDLVSKNEISADVDSPKFDAAFAAVTQVLPMNLGAWAPAQKFNALSQEEKLKAIEAFKSATNSRFNEYTASEEFQGYLTSPRYDLDKRMFRAYLKGETYKLTLDQPVRDCCSGVEKPVELVEPVIIEEQQKSCCGSLNQATEAGNDALNQPNPEAVQFKNVADVSDEPKAANTLLDRVKEQSEKPTRSRSSSPSREHLHRDAKNNTKKTIKLTGRK